MSDNQVVTEALLLKAAKNLLMSLREYPLRQDHWDDIQNLLNCKPETVKIGLLVKTDGSMSVEAMVSNVINGYRFFLLAYKGEYYVNLDSDTTKKNDKASRMINESFESGSLLTLTGDIFIVFE